MNKETLVFKPHTIKQQDAIFSDASITLLGTGIQFGKTISGAIWLKRQIHQHDEKENNFLIVAPTYKILSQSTLPPFLKYMEGFGDYNKAEACFTTHHGAKIFCRTNTDPDSIVGITNIRAIWGDEAGKFTLYFWENIQARAAFKDAPIMLTTSPYTLNWIYKELIKPHKAGAFTNVKVIQAASNENPYFPASVFEEKKRTMDPRRFQMLFGGEWGKMSGLVYDCFDEDLNTVEPFQLPMGTKYYGGIDWGFTDPFVLLIRAVTPDGRHYQISEFYKTGCTINDIIQLCQRKNAIFGRITYFADPSQPGYIEELCRNHISCIPADNDIRRGVDLHYELIKSRRFKLFKGTSPHSIDEYETYHYPEPEDLGPDDKGKDQLPVDQNNHVMDASRYPSSVKSLNFGSTWGSLGVVFSPVR